MSGWQSQQSGACLSCSTTLRDQDDDFGDHEHHNDGGDDKNLDYDGLQGCQSQQSGACLSYSTTLNDNYQDDFCVDEDDVDGVNYVDDVDPSEVAPNGSNLTMIRGNVSNRFGSLVKELYLYLLNSKINAKISKCKNSITNQSGTM